MKNLKEKFRKIDFIFVFLLFLIPVIFFAKQGDYPLIVVFLVIAAALSKARYNWVYFSQEYRDEVKSKLVKKRTFKEKYNTQIGGYIDLTALIIIALTILLVISLFTAKYEVALIFFIVDLLFIIFFYTFIKF